MSRVGDYRVITGNLNDIIALDSTISFPRQERRTGQLRSD
jgi:hypothetical protein